MKKYLMGIDNGGTYCKAAVFDLEGNQICKKSIQIPVYMPKEGYTQRKLEEIRDCNFKIIREAAAECDGEIAAIGIAGHGKGLYLLDRKKTFLYEGIGSTDARALKYELEWRSSECAERVYEKTAQRIMACQPVALLKWLKEYENDIYRQIGAVLSVKDFVRFCLTGEICTEYTDVSGTNLLNLRTKKYDRELLREFDIEEIYDALPPVRKSYDIAGRITQEAAEETGLKAGTPVVAGMFDIDSCALALGNVNPMDMCVIAGTWGINEYVSPQMIDNKTIAMNSVFCNQDYYLAEESSAASAGNLEWLMKLLKENDYEEINSLVEKVTPEECNLYYMPFLYASNENPLAKGMFVGLSGYHTKAHILRAVYEGVVFAHLTHVKALLRNRPAPEFIRLGGGVTNSRVWSQMFADILEIPVHLIHSVELGAKGAAMAAGVGVSIFKDYNEAAQVCIKKGETLFPDKSRQVIYRQKYRNYKQIIQSMDSVWKVIE